ncbi:SDR family oxidoreductase [bacterium]|nr:SDR family oxidoreductase [bacterium]
MSSKHCIVTGGAGFIGSHVVDRLLADGHTVTAIDNFSTGNPRNVAHLKDNKSFTLVQADIAATPNLADIFDGADWVIHLAALADIVPSIQKPREYYRSNVDGTFEVLEASRAAGVKRMVYAASSSCYGIPDVTPTPETAEIRTEYPYALTKHLGEKLVLHWAQVYKLPAVSLRFFNVYGPRARTTGTYGAVFGVFLAQKLAGKPFTVVGDGTQTRDFTYVTDIADAVVCAAESEISGEIMNVGSGGTYSINRLVELLGGPVTYIPKRPGEPDSTFADTSKIERLLGWKARVSFETGVKRMLEHIHDWEEAPVWTPDSISVATKEWFEYLSPREEVHE